MTGSWTDPEHPHRDLHHEVVTRLADLLISGRTSVDLDSILNDVADELQDRIDLCADDESERVFPVRWNGRDTTQRIHSRLGHTLNHVESVTERLDPWN